MSAAATGGSSVRRYLSTTGMLGERLGALSHESLVASGDGSRLNRHVTFAAVAAALGGILFGYDIGVIGAAQLQLKTAFELTCFQQAAVVSLMLVGASLGSLLSGPVVDLLGRKLSIMANAFVFVLGALVLSLSNSLAMLLVGRVIVGVGVACSAITECVYISEIAPPRQRGKLVSINELFMAVGVLLAYLVGHLLVETAAGWRWMFGLAAAPALLQILCLLWLPQSPRCLVMRGRYDEAALVLQRLRGSAASVTHELEAIKLAAQSERLTSVLQLCSGDNRMRFRTTVAIVLVIFQQITGQPNVLYYAPTIFQEIGFIEETAATLATLLLGVVKVFATVLSLLLVDRAGRRLFLLSGVLFMALSVGFLGLTSVGSMKAISPCDQSGSTNLSSSTTAWSTTPAVGVNATTDGGTWVHLMPSEAANQRRTAMRFLAAGALIVFVAAYAVGFGPASVRGRAVATASFFNWSTNLAVSLTFLDLISAVGMAGTFLIYSAVCLAAAVFIYFFIPETRGRSLERISEDLKYSSFGQRVRAALTRRPRASDGSIRVTTNGGYLEMTSLADNELNAHSLPDRS